MKLILIILACTLSLQSHAQSQEMNLNSMTNKSFPGLLSDDAINTIICTEGLEISDHMQKMGFIIRTLNGMLNSLINGDDLDDLKTAVLIDNQALRTHLIAVLPKTPEKIKNIDTKNIQKNKLIFQRYLTKMIGFSIDLETQLLRNPTAPDQIESQRIKIANLIISISDTVTEAHKLFKF